MQIQANLAKAADAVMLDMDGFVAETNATNIFLVTNGELITPLATACLPGITRSTILELAQTLGIRASERQVSLTELYCADEVFTTGTMGELTPVRSCDGRLIGSHLEQNGEKTNKLKRPITELLQKKYAEMALKI